MVDDPPRDGRAGIDAALVGRLIAAQFPRWRDLPVTPVEVDGWDNRTYRLGTELTVRLPTAEGYAPAIAKEHRWLPALAPHLPLPVPPIVARGAPGEGYPFAWSVRGWLEGEVTTAERVADMRRFARDLAAFLRALWRVDATGGPVAGAHSFHRGAPPAHYDGETRRALAALAGLSDAGIDAGIDAERAAAVWRDALDATWRGAPVWFHGDIAANNLLVRDGELAAVIDFGTSGVGDPACDLVIAWTLFTGAAREAFAEGVGQDEGTWARARGWALWKAAISLEGALDTDPVGAAHHRRVIEEVLADHAAHAP
ncbi:aminoglycoside phosphotransferase family protein [Streptomyces radicis]|uniref:Aminoglycoside phosphotransferase family protein n=1 Tax=Streptomyces radicis TaxID=1750517 RepID=A0A3A9WGE9_9ACTN|nr:aminoglycoside phosphotransferase family protein [Streptomyces radicis]RKN11890.1 aminoglycoside phosphotransferase family protein [Streptomyces radicis]RKN26060.1 aminoglycoside phosphotransferase family protein [Streptomyces radicis]